MIDSKVLPPLFKKGIELLPNHWIPNPQAYCSYEAYAFVAKMVDERENLLELLKQTRILRDEVTTARPPARFKDWYDALEKCEEIKI